MYLTKAESDLPMIKAAKAASLSQNRITSEDFQEEPRVTTASTAAMTSNSYVTVALFSRFTAAMCSQESGHEKPVVHSSTGTVRHAANTSTTGLLEGIGKDKVLGPVSIHHFSRSTLQNPVAKAGKSTA